MDPTWLELAKQAPSLVVLVILVVLFLRHLKEISAGFERAIKDIGNDCHLFQKETSERTSAALTRNTIALDRNSEALGYASKNGGR
jgi:hypothetical protein